MSNEKLNIKDIIKKEYIKCASDPIYFIKKYCKIRHPLRGKIPFALYPFQENVIKQFQNNRYVIVNKSRQLGLSTVISAYALWMMLFHKEKNILALATKVDTAKNLVSKVKLAYANLPSWLQLQVVEDNKLSLTLGNGSNIKAVSSSSDSARSEAVSLLIIDEAAFIDNIEKIWNSAFSTLSTGGSCILLSTPLGVGTWWHKMWSKAGPEPVGNGFFPIELPWHVHPERDQKWRDDQEIILGRYASNECDASFLSSGNSVVDYEILKHYEKTQLMEPLEKRGFDKGLWIFKYAEIGKSYIICADVSRGDGNDFSAFHILDIETLEQVAEYKGLIGTTEFGKLIMQCGIEYNNALAIIENASIGWSVIQTLIDNQYENIYYTFIDDMYIDPTVHIPQGYDTLTKDKMVPGFTTSQKTRPLMINKLDESFRLKLPIVHSKRFIDELYVFIWKNGTNGKTRAEAQPGYNDDLVMAYSIGLYTRDTALRLRSEGLSMTISTLQNLGKSRVKSSIEVSKQQLRNTFGWGMDTGRGYEDITWLTDNRK